MSSSSNVSLTETSNKNQQETSENTSSSSNSTSNNNNNDNNQGGSDAANSNIADSIDNSNKEDINYSNFMYWRNTLPSLDLKSSSQTTNNENSQVDTKMDEVPKSKSNDVDDNNDAQSISMLSTNPTSTLTELVAAQQQQQSNIKNNFDSIFNQKSSTTINQNNLYSSSNFLSIYTQQNQQQNQFGNKSLEELSDELKQVNSFFYKINGSIIFHNLI
jgi:hypothetical protein